MIDFNKVYTIDIETNNLLRDMLSYEQLPYKLNDEARLWCVVIRRLGDDAVFYQTCEGITKEWMQETLADCEYLIAHNGVKFDFLVLKLFGVLDYEIGHIDKPDLLFGRPMRFIDTLVLSRLLNPDRYPGHSLEAWGERLQEAKMDYRGELIDRGLLEKDAPSSAEFAFYNEVMLEYCIQDTNVNGKIFKALLKEMGRHNWQMAFKMEMKLADYGVRRETFGFSFDKEKAVACVEELTQIIEDIRQRVNPILPPRALTKAEETKYTLPKTQVKKDGTLSEAFSKRINELGAFCFFDKNVWKMLYEDQVYELPYNKPLKTSLPGTIENLDHVKMFLIQKGWVPLEWRERDLTRDLKKQKLPYEKQVETLKRYVKQTLVKGLYKEQRLEILGLTEENLYASLEYQLGSNKPVRVPTSPSVRVGVEKELCKNLVKLGKDIEFAKDFSLYLTYRHRLSSIAGGDIEDMDFDTETPNTGFLKHYREIDGRIPTPAIEIGASSCRYKHSVVCNVARPSSLYGSQLRGLFGCGKGYLQLGFDASALENRVQAGYIKKYPMGEEIGKSLVAEKPNDCHSVNASKLGISRSDAKSFGYATLYGAGPPKLAKMLSVPVKHGEELYSLFWEAMLPLKLLKEDLEAAWENGGQEFIISIDGRKIRTRSRHSLLNALFQSTGVICMKYTAVFLMEELEALGYCVDPFVGKPDVCSMIEYHDEQQLAVLPSLCKFEMFDTEEEAKEFVKNWTGSQLSTISHGKKFYVALPNVVSESILKATKRVEKILNLQFELGIEWVTGRNWADCH